MANRYVGKMIIVDTTDTQIGSGKGIKQATSQIGPASDLRIRAIKWVATDNSNKDIANEDDVNILYGDSDGDECIACRAQLAAVTGSVIYSVEFGSKPWIIPGLYVEDLDGGELQIFLD